MSDGFKHTTVTTQLSIIEVNRMIRERLIHIHYEDNSVRGYDDKDIREFYGAFGKVLAYGIANESEYGPVDYVSIYIDNLRNFTASIYKPDDTVAGLKKTATLWDTLSMFQQHEHHVITAKAKENGNGFTFEFPESQ